MGTLKITVHIPTPGSVLASLIEPGSVVMPLGSARTDGVRAICWECRGYAERVPSTFADRAERAYARSRDHRNDRRKLVDGGDLRAIGQLDTVTGSVTVDCERDADALAVWLETEELDEAELLTTHGVVLQMYRDLTRDHGELLPQQQTHSGFRSKRSG